MKTRSIDAKYKNSTYHFNRLFGFLLEKSSATPKKKSNLSEKVMKALNQIENPYQLTSFIGKRETQKQHNKTFVNGLAKIYTKLCLTSFIFVRLLSYIRVPIFDTTEDALLYYRKLFPGAQQYLCLPKVLFAATTSKSFKKDGVLFIGVFLPSRAMHAWIIEDNIQPDPFDDIWICFQPVAVLYI